MILFKDRDIFTQLINKTFFISLSMFTSLQGDILDDVKDVYTGSVKYMKDKKIADKVSDTIVSSYDSTKETTSEIVKFTKEFWEDSNISNKSIAMYDDTLDFSGDMWKTHKSEILIGASTIAVVVLELNGIPVTSFALSSADGISSILTKSKNKKGLEKLGFKSYGDIATSVFKLPKNAVGIFQYVDKRTGIVKHVSSMMDFTDDKNSTDLELFFKPYKNNQYKEMKSFETFIKGIFNLN